jgi:hypothetical protein
MTNVLYVRNSVMTLTFTVPCSTVFSIDVSRRSRREGFVFDARHRNVPRYLHATYATPRRDAGPKTFTDRSAARTTIEAASATPAQLRSSMSSSAGAN